MAIEPLQSAPYPVGTDAPDGPTQILALASWARRQVLQVYASAAARTAGFPAAGISPAEGMVSYRTDEDTWEEWDGSAWVPHVESGVWTNMPMPGGWANVAGTTPWQYRRIRRRVLFRGSVNIPASTGTGSLLTMPAGHRPTAGQIQLAVPYSNGTAVSAHQRFNIGTNGVMAMGVTTPAATIQAMWEGLSYSVD